MIEFGLKAAYEPTAVTDADVERLRALGHSDAALVEIVSTALIAHNLAARQPGLRPEAVGGA